jgi:hypothetical protein
MAEKAKPARPRDEAAQVFRQFAWNIAGSLARPIGRRGGKPATSGAVKR